MGGDPPVHKRLRDPLEYDFGMFGHPKLTLYIVFGGEPPPLREAGCWHCVWEEISWARQDVFVEAYEE